MPETSARANVTRHRPLSASSSVGNLHAVVRRFTALCSGLMYQTHYGGRHTLIDMMINSLLSLYIIDQIISVYELVTTARRLTAI